jgi:hypothetical protein
MEYDRFLVESGEIAVLAEEHLREVEQARDAFQSFCERHGALEYRLFNRLGSLGSSGEITLHTTDIALRFDLSGSLPEGFSPRSSGWAVPTAQSEAGIMLLEEISELPELPMPHGVARAIGLGSPIRVLESGRARSIMVESFDGDLVLSIPRQPELNWKPPRGLTKIDDIEYEAMRDATIHALEQPKRRITL